MHWHHRYPKPRLYAESFAPWCEKARWALDHHGMGYRSIEHVPLLGELRLRWVARRPFGRVSVPLLVTGEGRLTDSLAIAQWAEREGAGQPLFPAEWADEVMSWNQRSEALMEAGRGLLLLRLLENDEALLEQLPAVIPSGLRRAVKPVAAHGVGFLMGKYGITAGQAKHYEATARQLLETLRKAFAVDGRHLVGDRFTYADISMASALQFFSPVADEFVPLGSSTRAAWTHLPFEAESADLIAWRDHLYTERRLTRAHQHGTTGNVSGGVG